MEHIKTLRAVFDAAEKAEQAASREYHATVPQSEKTQERYATHMRSYWDASQRAYEAFRAAGGRLGA